MLIARVNDGIHLSEPEQRIIRTWKVAEVRIEPYDEARKRTLQQNKYLWTIYGYIASHTGHSTEDIHEFLKAELLPRKFLRVGDEERYIGKSTTKLSTTEFTHYIEAVRAWASMELGISTPDPQP